MIAALLLAAAAPTAIDAERAFAADAQKLGQWTAFRKYATDDALMFVPQPTNAQTFLKDRKDPTKSVDWQPFASFVSCDGKVAVNHGPWQRPDGSVGHFFTVWKKQMAAGTNEGWRWVFDAGKQRSSPLSAPNPPVVRTASCANVPANVKPTGMTSPGSIAPSGPENGLGISPDRSLAWFWAYSEKRGTWLHVEIWNGRRFQTVIDAQVAEP